MKELREAFGKLLQRRIAYHGLTVTDVARWLGVTPRKMYRVFSGERALHAATLRCIEHNGLRHDLVQWLLDPHGEVITAREASDPASWSIGGISELATQSGALVGEFIEAAADGLVDRQEAAEMMGRFDRVASICREGSDRCKRIVTSHGVERIQ